MDVRQDNKAITLDKLKGQLLKQFLQTEILDSKGQEALKLTHDLEEMWIILFAKCSSDVFDRLHKHGILPTQAELSYVSKRFGNTNSWFWLAEREVWKSTLNFLFKKEIFPTSHDLSIRSDCHQYNAWWLLSFGPNIKNFLTLLQFDIFPQQSDMNASLYHNKNMWFNIVSNNDHSNRGLSIFLELLKKNILPSANDLSLCHAISGVSTWTLLLQQKNFVLVFKKLILGHHIYPGSHELSKMFLVNSKEWTGWRFLASDDSHMPILKKLLDNNIFPSKEVLSKKDEDGQSLWLQLSARQNVEYFRILLEKYKPTTKDFFGSDEKISSNLWHNLAKNSGADVMANLFQLNIFPTVEALNAIDDDHQNVWWKLAFNNKFFIVYSLLDKGLLPKRENLSQYSTEKWINTWQLLFIKHDITSIKRFIKLGILPSHQDLDIACDDSFSENAWDHMNVIPDYFPVLEILNDNDILPGHRHSVEAPYGVLKAMVERVIFIEKLQKEYNVSQRHFALVLLSRNNQTDFYGFLYLFQLMRIKQEKKIRPEINLPLPIWYLIGKHLLPSYIDYSMFQSLNTNESRNIFKKYYAEQRVDDYLGIFSFFKKRARVNSLIDMVKVSDDPSYVMRQQHCMMLFPSKAPLSSSNLSHLKPFGSRLSDEKLEDILNDGFLLR